MRVRRRAGRHEMPSSRAASGAWTRTSPKPTARCASRDRSAPCRSAATRAYAACRPRPRARASARPTMARCEALDISNDYTEALPSVNITFNLAEDKMLRVGLARVIARPPLDELRASRRCGTRPSRSTAAAAIRISIRSSPTRPTSRSSGISARRSAGGARGVLQGRRQPHRLQHAAGDHRRRHLRGHRPFNGEGGGITGAEFTFQTPFAQSGSRTSAST